MMWLQLLALVTTADPIPNANPLTQAEAGFELCFEPDDVKKTCQAVSTYERRPDGRWNNRSISPLIGTGPPLTLETVSVVYPRNGSICAIGSKDEILNGRVSAPDRALRKQEADTILNAFAAALAPMIGKELCMEFMDGGSAVSATGDFNGKRLPVKKQRVKWVRPADGYVFALPVETRR